MTSDTFIGVDARIDKILEHVRNGKLVTLESENGALVVTDSNAWSKRPVLRGMLTTGARCFVREDHVRGEMDSAAFRSLLGAHLRLSDDATVVCDGWAAASKVMPELISAGDRVYTAKDLYDQNILWCMHGNKGPFLPCCSFRLNDGGFEL